MTPPDISIVVPVYNTMPYLTQCLDSLIAQTIGLDRMQIVAVDDGSTDRSGAELDRFAERYPGVVTVIHQPNSGGPAGPCNRALDVATGRYVFFVGADDHLGPQAAERLVAAADAWGSDVVLGKVTGVHSRHIYQDVFARTEPDLDLFGPALPRSLANTKLFRRDLLETHGIRYREDMPIGSDLPFTLAACLHARRISVLADYDFYFAVRRFSATNITYLSRHAEKLRTVEKVVAYVAGLIEPGKRREAILLRRFDHEVARLLEDDLLRLDRPTQELVHRGVGKLVAEHLTGNIAAGLNAETRIRLALTRDGSVDDLLAAIRQDAQVGVPPTVVTGGRSYAAYPGARTEPGSAWDVTSAPDWAAKLDAVEASWETGARGERLLVLTAHTPARELADLPGVGAEEVRAEVTPIASDESGTTLRITFRVADLIAGSGSTGRRRIVSAQTGPFDPAVAPGTENATGAAGAATVRAPRLSRRPSSVGRSGARLLVITPVVDTSGRLMISVVPFTTRRVTARLKNLIRR